MSRNKPRKARFLAKEYLEDILASKPFPDDNILLNCSFISESALPDDDVDENMDICENDNSSKIEDANEDAFKTNEAESDICENVSNESNPPTMLSPITTPKDSNLKPSGETKSDNFQEVKQPKNKKRMNKRDFGFYLCEKNKVKAETQLKLALNYLNKVLSCNVATAPVFIGTTPPGHHEFSTKVRSDIAERAFKCIERGDLKSWNVVAVRLDDEEDVTGPKKSRHKHCDFLAGNGEI